MILSQYFITKKESNFVWIRGIYKVSEKYNKNSTCCIQWYIVEYKSRYFIENTTYVLAMPFSEAAIALKSIDNIESFLVYNVFEKSFETKFFWQQNDRTKQEFISWLEECSKKAIKCVGTCII